MDFKVDYHFHSWYSDGTMKPTELVRKYKDDGYDEISLTDHDGIDGVREALIAGEALGIQVVTGIEFSTNYFVEGETKPFDVHLLGYRFDLDNPKLQEKCKQLIEYRNSRNKVMLDTLNKMGYEITMEDLVDRPGQTYFGKPNFARALAKKGYVDNPKAAFKAGEFLESPEIKAIEKTKMKIDEAIELLKEAGGLSVLAHPMELMDDNRFKGKSKEFFFEHLFIYLKDLKKKGLKGLECYHPSADDGDSEKLVSFAEKLHLHITRGSDYHG